MASLETLGDFVTQAMERFEAADLHYGHGTATAFEEAVFIVLETLGIPVDGDEPDWGQALGEPDRRKLTMVIDARIATRKPAPYLVNRAYIQGFPFYVDERVIVPRSFIGELLCNQIYGDGTLSFLDKRRKAGKVLDLCTGSGCLAILAAHAFPEADIDAVDLSMDALEVARRNVKNHDMAARITLYGGDLFRPLAGQTYDVIITNPPYVDAEAMAELPPEYRHEPAMALGMCGDDGLDLVRRIIDEAPAYLSDGGGLLCEIGRGKENLEAAYPDFPFLWLETAESSGEVFWITREQLTGKG
jgi:ribosomal protein L3 glutamine methyltransferase